MAVNSRVIIPTTIANGAAVSAPIYIATLMPVALSVEFPSVWTAADLIIEVTRQHARRDLAATLVDGNWIKLRDAAGAIIKLTSIPTAAVSLLSFATATNEQALRTIQNYSWLRVRSVSTADVTVDANQGAARTLRLGLIR